MKIRGAQIVQAYIDSHRLAKRFFVSADRSDLRAHVEMKQFYTIEQVLGPEPIYGAN